jgi:hypothetical protein
MNKQLTGNKKEKKKSNAATGNRKKLDADGDGKITKKDFALLRQRKGTNMKTKMAKGNSVKMSKGGAVKMSKGGSVMKKMAKGGSVMTKMSKGGAVRRGYGMARGGKVK